jgi:hypothetical protein
MLSGAKKCQRSMESCCTGVEECLGNCLECSDTVEARALRQTIDVSEQRQCSVGIDAVDTYSTEVRIECE